MDHKLGASQFDCRLGRRLVPTFDLVVFLYIPPDVRLARLLTRERERFGTAVEPNGSMYEQHQAFLRSAAGYDTGASGRTLETDASWLAQLNCPVMLITGGRSTYDQVDHILSSQCSSEISRGMVLMHLRVVTSARLRAGRALARAGKSGPGTIGEPWWRPPSAA